MSLINRMLKDLETGRPAAETSCLQGLQAPVQPDRPARRGGWILLAVLVAAAGVAAVVLWQQRSKVEPTPIAATREPLPAVAPPAEAVTPPVPMVAEPVAEPVSVEEVAIPSAPPVATVAASVAAPPAPVPDIPPNKVPAAVPDTMLPKAQVASPAVPEPAFVRVPADLYNQARERLQAGDAATAQQQLEELLTREPDHHAGRDLLVELLLERGEMTAAEAQLREGIRHAPDYWPFRWQLGRLCLAQGRLAEAGVQAQALTREPGPQAAPEWHGFVANLDYRQGAYAAAAERYRQLQAVRPQTRWLVGLAAAAEARGDGETARSAYREVLADPAASPALHAFAKSRLQALAGGR